MWMIQGNCIVGKPTLTRGDSPKAATLECPVQPAGGWAMAESPLLSHSVAYLALGRGLVNLVHFSSPTRKF